MGRVGISYEVVENIAETILQQGEMPTIERIRFKLGTGSNTTISKYLKEWRSVRLKAMPDVLPTLNTAPDPVNRAVGQVWQELKEQSDQALTKYKAEKEHEIAELTERYDSQVEKLTSELTEKSEALENLQQAHEHKKRDVLSLDLELQDAQQSIAVKDETIHRLQIQLERIQLEQQRLETISREANQLHQRQFDSIKAESQATCHRLETNYQQQISEQKESSETMRHQLIADIDGWKTKCRQQEGQLEDEKQRRTSLEKDVLSYQQQAKTTADVALLIESLAEQQKENAAQQSVQFEQQLLPIQLNQTQLQSQLTDISSKLVSLAELNVEADND